MDIAELLAFSVKNKASDLHLSAGLPPMIRVDGDVRRINIPALDHKQVHSLVYDIMSDKQRRDYEEFLETDFSFEISGLARFRVNAFNQNRGAGAVFRTIPSEVLTLDDLAAPAIFKELVDQPQGLILVTGPTGSGKTTTLYTTLKQLAVPEINVCTVEDPIEMIVPALNQMQVQPTIDLTFEQGIRTLLRQDPDIIMVGEIRDLATAEMAVQAALTGHLVLSTLHTNDAVSAVTRLLDLGVPYYLIQNVLIGVMAQRLVRTLCPYCKTSGQIEDGLWEALVRPWSLPKPDTVGVPQGCSECRKTGYLGRVGLYELLMVTPELRRLLRAETDEELVRRGAFEQGMHPLRISAASQIAAGLTTFEEVMQTLPPLDEG